MSNLTSSDLRKIENIVEKHTEWGLSLFFIFIFTFSSCTGLSSLRGDIKDLSDKCTCTERVTE